MLDRADIKTLANKVKLELDEKETDAILTEINRRIADAERMLSIDTDGIPPTVSSLENVYDEDELLIEEIEIFKNGDE